MLDESNCFLDFDLEVGCENVGYSELPDNDSTSHRFRST